MANVRPLPPVLVEAAKNELHEEPGRLEADLEHLKAWLAKQPHLKARTDDQFLVTFLRGSKFSLERAKEKLDSYYTLHTALPEFFSNRNPTSPEMQHLFKLGVFVPLGLDTEGRRVLLIRLTVHDPSTVKLVDVFKIVLLMTDILLLEDDANTIKGQVALVDLGGMGIAHSAQYTPAILKKGVTAYQDGFPLRPKGLHYINMSPTFETLFKLLKSFLNDKLRKRLQVHPNLTSLYQNIPREVLPAEYGGSAGHIQDLANALAKKMEAWRQHFLDDAHYGADESKRPGKPKTHQDLFGLEGSFRPLNID